MEGKCRLLPELHNIAEHQRDAFFSDGLNIREHAGNESAPCKTLWSIAEKKNPADAATSNGAVDRLKSEKPYIWGSAFATLDLEGTLSLKPNGWYHVEPEDDWFKVTIHRPGCPPEIVMCYTEGHANQYRLQLSDEGMAGLIEGAA